VSSAVLPERVRASDDAPDWYGERGMVSPSVEAAPVRVIYIAGYGRSGTTLLDIALGQHSGVMGAGEIATLARHVWPNDEYCACGARVHSCPMWRGIVETWAQGDETDLIDDFRRAQERTETILGIGRLIERWRSGRHAARTSKLFEAIATQSGCAVVVDSSKLPGRAFALAATHGIELTVVHVVRDARGVAWSLKRGFKRQIDVGVQRELVPKPLLYTALRWMIVNLATERLCRRVGPSRSMRIRYEDFVSDPQGIVRRILALAGRDVAVEPGFAPGPMFPKHQVAGSRHRMQPEIVVAQDERWKGAMPRLQQWLITLVCAPLLWRYGYPLRIAAAKEKGA